MGRRFYTRRRAPSSPGARAGAWTPPRTTTGGFPPGAPALGGAIKASVDARIPRLLPIGLRNVLKPGLHRSHAATPEPPEPPATPTTPTAAT
jgi:hypothetical protein